MCAKNLLKLFYEATQKNKLLFLGRKMSTEYTTMTVYIFK